jgi:hypothetical protein
MPLSAEYWFLFPAAIAIATVAMGVFMLFMVL